MEQEEIVFCKGGGCMAKLGPGTLVKVLDRLPKTYDLNLLIGYGRADDMAVYEPVDDLVMIQTLDFFSPMVEDPYIFGQIAVANTLSDICAMGSDVRITLSIVCFPEAMDLNILGKILLGGSEKVKEAGDILAGGHSIADADVKYGLSITGTIHSGEVSANSGCREGDALLLTKSLSVGIACTASRVGEETGAAMDLAARPITSLSRYASEIVRKYRVHGCTDMANFSSLGHLCEMLGDSYTALTHKDRTLLIPGCETYVKEFHITAAGQRNWNRMGVKVEFVGCSFTLEETLYDPQTSGGPLVSMERQGADRALEELQDLGLPCGTVGETQVRSEKAVVVS